MEVTLKSSLNRIMLITLGLVTFVAIAFIFSYSQLKETLSNRSLKDSLLSSVPAQIDALLPSFLILEQKSGISLLLNRFKEKEELESITLVSIEEELPKDFKKNFPQCIPLNKAHTCVSNDHSHIGVIVPVAESGRTLGHLFKSKKIQNPFINDNVLFMIEIGTGVLIIALLLLFLFIGRVTSQELPSELNNLVIWLEKVLRDEIPAKAPQLKFKELNELGRKITEVIQKHDKIRDQALIGQLTSGIMHDIKTPIHSMVAAMHLAHEQPIGSPKRQARLENLLNTNFRNLPLIGKIIETTLDANRDIHIDRSATNIKETLVDALDSLSETARQRNVEVQTDFPQSNFSVIHDPVQMSRVFSNIFKNALEAGRKDLVHRHQVKISIEELAPSSLRVVFEDSGTGLPPNPESIFRIFKSSKPRGTGLGLVISKKIVESHQGKLIPLQSTSLQGARFEIILPRTIQEKGIPT